MTLNLFSSLFKFQFKLNNNNNSLSDFEKKIINIINFENRIDSSNHFAVGDNISNNKNIQSVSSIKNESKTHLVVKIIMMLTNELIESKINNDFYKIYFIQKCVQEKIYIISIYKKKFKYRLFKTSRFNKFINYYDNYLKAFLSKYNHIFNTQPKITFDVFNKYNFEHCLLPEQLKKINNDIPQKPEKNIFNNNPHSNILLLPDNYERQRPRFASFNLDRSKA
jgi:hypothetical protein